MLSKTATLALPAPPKATPAAEKAYRHVKQLVLTDELPGGTMVSEGDIAARLTMSRTPVREAFLRLETEGWLRLYPKRGALVVPVAAGEAQSVVDARLLLEVHAVEALRNRDERERLEARLRASIDQQRDALDRGDIDAYAEHDTEFHLTIVAGGGNPLLTSFYVTLRERQRRMVARSLWRDEGRARAFVDQHEHLAAAVGAGAVAEFRVALRRHLDHAHLPERAAEAGEAR
ncbi:GntR family transcriptional regulator [Cellulomonas sp. P22]|uniref:GntR family transcriptional regulator n=1 Tax=Cellulomonas sp. P22 TaxID=3373189 RepID=UPI00378E75BF